MRTTRRDFLMASGGASAWLALGAGAPGWFERTARAAAAAAADRGTVLVVVQLSGGNDGLNTVVPYEDDAYQRSRPTLRLGADRVLKLEKGIGLHPEMPALLRLYREGCLGIVQGVGYPNSNRDHEAAMRHWHTARPEETLAQTGWAGRAIDLAAARAPTGVPGVFVGSIPAPFSLRTEQAVAPALNSIAQWLPRPDWLRGGVAEGNGGSGAGSPRAAGAVGAATATGAERFPAQDSLPASVREAARDARAAGERLRAALSASGPDYPPYPLAQSLKSVAQLMRADLGIRLFLAEQGGGGIGGFDTHAGQATNHGALLRELSESLAAFVADLRRDRLLDTMLLMTFSEFGRTLSENGRRGTGHGAAQPLLLAGGGAHPGLIGPHPSLTDLDQDAPKFHTDFRRVYATLLDRWLGLDSGAVLGAKFASVDGLVKD